MTVWDVQARLRQLLDHPQPTAAANTARALLAELVGDAFVRPGDTMDEILDMYSAIQFRAGVPAS